MFALKHAEGSRERERERERERVCEVNLLQLVARFCDSSLPLHRPYDLYGTGRERTEGPE